MKINMSEEVKKSGDPLRGEKKKLEKESGRLEALEKKLAALGGIPELSEAAQSMMTRLSELRGSLEKIGDVKTKEEITALQEGVARFSKEVKGVEARLEHVNTKYREGLEAEIAAQIGALSPDSLSAFVAFVEGKKTEMSTRPQVGREKTVSEHCIIFLDATIAAAQGAMTALASSSAEDFDRTVTVITKLQAPRDYKAMLKPVLERIRPMLEAKRATLPKVAPEAPAAEAEPAAPAVEAPSAPAEAPAPAPVAAEGALLEPGAPSAAPETGAEKQAVKEIVQRVRAAVENFSSGSLSLADASAAITQEFDALKKLSGNGEAKSWLPIVKKADGLLKALPEAIVKVETNPLQSIGVAASLLAKWPNEYSNRERKDLFELVRQGAKRLIETRAEERAGELAAASADPAAAESAPAVEEPAPAEAAPEPAVLAPDAAAIQASEDAAAADLLARIGALPDPAAAEPAPAAGEPAPTQAAPEPAVLAPDAAAEPAPPAAPKSARERMAEEAAALAAKNAAAEAERQRKTEEALAQARAAVQSGGVDLAGGAYREPADADDLRDRSVERRSERTTFSSADVGTIIRIDADRDSQQKGAGEVPAKIVAVLVRTLDASKPRAYRRGKPGAGEDHKKSDELRRVADGEYGTHVQLQGVPGETSLDKFQIATLSSYDLEQWKRHRILPIDWVIKETRQPTREDEEREEARRAALDAKRKEAKGEMVEFAGASYKKDGIYAFKKGDQKVYVHVRGLTPEGKIILEDIRNPATKPAVSAEDFQREGLSLVPAEEAIRRQEEERANAERRFQPGATVYIDFLRGMDFGDAGDQREKKYMPARVTRTFKTDGELMVQLESLDPEILSLNRRVFRLDGKYVDGWRREQVLPASFLYGADEVDVEEIIATTEYSGGAGAGQRDGEARQEPPVVAPNEAEPPARPDTQQEKEITADIRQRFYEEFERVWGDAIKHMERTFPENGQTVTRKVWIVEFDDEGTKREWTVRRVEREYGNDGWELPEALDDEGLTPAQVEQLFSDWWVQVKMPALRTTEAEAERLAQAQQTQGEPASGGAGETAEPDEDEGEEELSLPEPDEEAEEAAAPEVVPAETVVATGGEAAPVEPTVPTEVSEPEPTPTSASEAGVETAEPGVLAVPAEVFIEIAGAYQLKEVMGMFADGRNAGEIQKKLAALFDGISGEQKTRLEPALKKAGYTNFDAFRRKWKGELHQTVFAAVSEHIRQQVEMAIDADPEYQKEKRGKWYSPARWKRAVLQAAPAIGIGAGVGLGLAALGVAAGPLMFAAAGAAGKVAGEIIKDVRKKRQQTHDMGDQIIRNDVETKLREKMKRNVETEGHLRLGATLSILLARVTKPGEVSPVSLAQIEAGIAHEMTEAAKDLVNKKERGSEELLRARRMEEFFALARAEREEAHTARDKDWKEKAKRYALAAVHGGTAGAAIGWAGGSEFIGQVAEKFGVSETAAALASKAFARFNVGAAGGFIARFGAERMRAGEVPTDLLDAYIAQVERESPAEAKILRNNLEEILQKQQTTTLDQVKAALGTAAKTGALAVGLGMLFDLARGAIVEQARPETPVAKESEPATAEARPVAPPVPAPIESAPRLSTTPEITPEQFQAKFGHALVGKGEGLSHAATRDFLFNPSARQAYMANIPDLKGLDTARLDRIAEALRGNGGDFDKLTANDEQFIRGVAKDVSDFNGFTDYHVKLDNGNTLATIFDKASGRHKLLVVDANGRPQFDADVKGYLREVDYADVLKEHGLDFSNARPNQAGEPAGFVAEGEGVRAFGLVQDGNEFVPGPNFRITYDHDAIPPEVMKPILADVETTKVPAYAGTPYESQYQLSGGGGNVEAIGRLSETGDLAPTEGWAVTFKDGSMIGRMKLDPETGTLSPTAGSKYIAYSLPEQYQEVGLTGKEPASIGGELVFPNKGEALRALTEAPDAKAGVGATPEVSAERVAVSPEMSVRFNDALLDLAKNDFMPKVSPDVYASVDSATRQFMDTVNDKLGEAIGQMSDEAVDGKVAALLRSGGSPDALAAAIRTDLLSHLDSSIRKEAEILLSGKVQGQDFKMDLQPPYGHAFKYFAPDGTAHFVYDPEHTFRPGQTGEAGVVAKLDARGHVVDSWNPPA